MAGVERMSGMDQMRAITQVDALPKRSLRLMWSDGTVAEIDAAALPAGKPKLGDWGHSLCWPDGEEVGADRLWLETLTAAGHADARQFLEWRMRHGLSLAKAADALGISRRSVAYYSKADRPVPKAILLACLGWERGDPLARAA
jgi:hypothetical protein